MVGKDFGSWPVYLLSLLHPTRISGIVSLGVPFFPPRPLRYKDLPEGFYINRWKVHAFFFFASFSCSGTLGFLCNISNLSKLVILEDEGLSLSLFFNWKSVEMMLMMCYHSASFSF